MICKNCGKELNKKQISKKNSFCCKGCATSFRQKANDPNPLLEESDLKYYLLGLIFSDGNLSYSKNLKKMSIRLNDYDIISLLYPKFSDINKRIIYQEDFETFKGLVTSFMILNTNNDCISIAESFGLTSRKSLNLKFPSIDKRFLSDFIRGYFDGDGSVYKSSTYKNTNYYGVSFTSGSKEFLDELSKILKENNIENNVISDSRKTCYYLKIYRKQSVLNFYKFIYNDSIYFMKRKFNIFIKDIV